MIRSLFGKLFSFTSAIICLGIAVLVLMFSIISAQAWNSERLSALESCVNSICSTYKQLSTNGDADDIEITAYTVSNAYNATVFIVNTSGLTEYCSDFINHQNCIHLHNKIDPDIMKVVTDTGKYKETGRLKNIYSKNYYTVGAALIGYSGNVDGAVFVSFATDAGSNYSSLIISATVIVSFFVLMALMILLYILSKGMLAPIHEMTDAAKVMQRGDFSRRVSVKKRNDEIKELADSFNAMATSFESLEKMSSSFVSNVSHELKTPMTTIGGFVDGILNGTIPREKSDHYLKIVSEEIKRLSSVVNSMLALSKLESGREVLSYSKTDIVDIICRVIISFENQLYSKKIDIIGIENLDRFYIECDSELIYQVIYNLFDNAVKYTPKDGYISVFINESNSNFELYIKNSGEGISEEEQKYIFDRFYKIDQSRSLDKTGFGLGLNIVKSIISYHNGNIQIKSIPGQYTQFCVMLPSKRINGDNNE